MTLAFENEHFLYKALWPESEAYWVYSLQISGHILNTPGWQIIPTSFLFLVRMTVVLHARDPGVLLIYGWEEKKEMLKIFRLVWKSQRDCKFTDGIPEGSYISLRCYVMIDLMITCWTTSRNTSSFYFAIPPLTPNLLLHQMALRCAVTQVYFYRPYSCCTYFHFTPPELYRIGV